MHAHVVLISEFCAWLCQNIGLDILKFYADDPPKPANLKNPMTINNMTHSWSLTLEWTNDLEVYGKSCVETRVTPPCRKSAQDTKREQVVNNLLCLCCVAFIRSLSSVDIGGNIELLHDM